MIALPDRWYPLRPHPGQSAVWNSRARFMCIECGRRSGKTEIGVKRVGVRKAIQGGVNVVLGEPTHQQARRVLWPDIKALVPPALVRRIYEGESRIELQNASTIFVGGMDAPARFEGFPIDHLALDEAADCKEEVYDHLRPSLDTPGRFPGTGVFTGTPDYVSGPWFANLCDQASRVDWEDWEYHHWTSEGVVDPKLIEEARRSMPDDVFEQEFLAKRISASGRVYHAFEEALHVWPSVKYDPRLPLILALDFNVDPGVCLLIQEQENRSAGGRIARLRGERRWGNERYLDSITTVVDEIYIPKSSNTARIMRTFLERYPEHPGDILLHGDPAGGARSTKHEHVGGDWQIVMDVLETVYPHERIYPCWSRKAPPIRTSVGAVNGRFCNANHEIGIVIDAECRQLIRDLKYVKLVKGAAYDIDKTDLTLTHLTDALRYFMAQEHPMLEQVVAEHRW